MDRKSFLTTLKRTLWWRLPPEELSAVLEDYNEYFDSGTAEGKSEAELCTQFGKPSEIANDIVAERGSKYYSVALASMGVCVGLLIVTILMATTPSWFHTSDSANLVYAVIFVLSTLSLLLARGTVGTAIAVRLSRWVTVTGIVLCVLCIAIVVVCTATLELTLQSEQFNLWFMTNINPELLGPIMWYAILTPALLCVILLWVVVLLRSASLRRYQLVTIPICATLLSLLVGYMLLLGQLSAPSAFLPAVFAIAKRALLQLLPVILVFTPRKGGSRNG